jgi:hypothetical protein
MNNADIIELANLAIDVDQTEDPTLVQRFEISVKQISSGLDGVLWKLAYNLLNGRSYTFSTDNRESMERCFDLAEELYATTKYLSDSDMPWWAVQNSGPYTFRFEPHDPRMERPID